VILWALKSEKSRRYDHQGAERRRSPYQQQGKGGLLNEIEKHRTAEIVELHLKFDASIRKTWEIGAKIGQLLTEQKAELKHGGFGSWIEKNLPFTDRTARNYMTLFRNRDRLKTETVSDFKSAYKLLCEPKADFSPVKNKPVETLTLFDADTTCMSVSKDIQDKCKSAILHPIKMDNVLDQYRGDPEIECTDIYEIIAIRDTLTVADYVEFVPLKIAALKEEAARAYCMFDIEDHESGEKHLGADEIAEIEKKAREHEEQRDRLNKKIELILKGK